MKHFSPASCLLGWSCLVTVSLAGAAAPAPETEHRTAAIRDIFRPFQTDQAALAPDGKHLAFEKPANEQLFLAIIDLATNQVMELPLTTDIAVPLSGVDEKLPGRITYLKWPTADRLVACVQDEVL